MAWQLIFTSAPRTLSAGQSGYGTVARSADLREGLAQRLEQLSYYGHATDRTRSNPVVCAYRILDLRGTKYHALTRIQDAGLDFTHRTNHLAHHLVFAQAELPTLPPPTVIFRQWNGWRADWRDEPRLLVAGDWGNFDQLPRKIALPAQAWQQTTGDAGSAAALLERPCVNGCYLLAGTDEETPLLALFGESLQLLDPAGQSPAKLWQHSFTTLLQAEDQPADFCWRGCTAETAAQRGNDAPVIVAATLRPPAGALAQLARQGLRPIPKPSVPTAAPADAPSSPAATRLTLQGAAPRVPIRGWDEASLTPTGTRSRKRGRTITLDFTAPRVLWPTVGLLLLLVFLLGGLVWPGFLKTRPTAEPAAPTGPKASRPSANDLTIAPVPDLKSQIPNLKSSPPPALPPSEAALSQIREHFATLETKTYLYLCDANQPVTLSPGPELALLLKELFPDNAAPLSRDQVECFLESGRLELDAPKPPPLPLKVDSTGGQKSLSAVNDAGLGFTLFAAEWLKDSHNPLSLVAVGSPPKALKILLQPVAGQKSFAPFRLVLVFEPVAPIQLSKTLLLADRASFENSLSSELLARWKALAREGVVASQLRPALRGDAKQDLLDRCRILPSALRPAPGAELDFTELRERIAAETKGQEAKASKLGGQVLELNRRIEENNQRHLAIGERSDRKEDLPRDFFGFAKREKLEPDRRSFETYLHRLAARCKLEKPAQDLIPGKDTPEAKAVADLAQFHAALVASGHEKALADVPQDYFAKRWQELGLVHERNRQRQLLTDAQQAAADLLGLLDATPASLEETPLVRLLLNRPSGPPVEFIRFTDKPPATTPKP